MRVLIWHVHGSWANLFVRGDHEYLLPTVDDRGPMGRGRARSWEWPTTVVEVSPAETADLDVDIVVLQRPQEAGWFHRWTGRRPGVDLPAVYVEHNTPGSDVPFTRHPLADQDAIPIVHVTHFNRLMWDCGRAPTSVIEHGAIDHGARYTGSMPRAAVVSNDPVRRGRAVGTDLLTPLAAVSPVDVFGMRVSALPIAAQSPADQVRTFEGLTQDAMLQELADRRVYVHLTRWTSLGLSLLEAMSIGMPVVALATTEVPAAVPADAGVVSARPDVLWDGVRRFIDDVDAAREAGSRARAHVLQHYSLDRFLAEWDAMLNATVAAHPRAR